MKRIILIIIAMWILLSSTACFGGGGDTTESQSLREESVSETDNVGSGADSTETTTESDTETSTKSETETETETDTETSTKSETETDTETETDIPPCEHGEYAEAREGGEYRYTCSSCGELLYTQKVAENVEVFVSPVALAEKYSGNTTDIGGFVMTVNADECYIRVRGGGSHGIYNILNVYENDGSAVSGQYMLIKYRIGKNGLRQDALQMFVSTETGEIVSSKQYVEFSVSEDNTWHVALVDLSKLTGNVNGSDYLPDEDGKYRAQLIQMRPVTHNASDGSKNDYMDIAYIALFDDVADLKSIVVEETYENHTARDSFCVVQTATNSCIECSFAQVEREGVYSFECPGCGKVYSQLDATGIKGFYSPSQIAKPVGNVFLTNKGVQMDDDGTVYTRIYGGGHEYGAQLQLVLGGSPTVDHGKVRYAVMKVRSNLPGNSFTISTMTLSGKSSPVAWPSNKVSADKWITAVIDLEACAPTVIAQNPDGSYTLDRLTIVFAPGFTTSAYYDFAYIALCRDWSEVEQIVDQDTVEFRDASGYKTISHDADPNNDADRVETETEPEGEESEDTEVETTIIYDRYDLDSYMEPVWNGNIVRNETVMFVGINDKMQLLYDADEIISVRSYDLKTEYVRGVDYDYVNGYLVLLEGTRIPYITEEQYYTAPEKDYLYTMYQGKETATLWGEGDTMVKWQLAVTYKPSSQWSGYEVPCNSDKYADFIKKLENGEDVTVFFYGDSITTGANSSGTINVEPYAASWPLMFTQYMAKKYGYTVEYVNTGLSNTASVPGTTVYGDRGTITYVNTAVGGWSTQQGLENVEKHVNDIVKDYGCDLFVLAYGMNNAGTSPAVLVGLLEDIVERVQVYAPDMDVVLVATMVPNPESVRGWYGNQEKFETPMITLADKLNKNGTSCAVAPVTSMSLSVLERKRFRDHTGNNINHPNDFMARIYAHVLVETVFGYDNLPE